MDRINRASIVVDIDKLKPSPFNSFKIVDLDELENDIKTYGLLTPLSVIGPDENGYYIILCGERRYHVLSKLHEESSELYAKVPCLLLGPATMDETMQQLIIEVSNVSTRTFDQTPHRMKIVSLLKEMADSGEIRKSSIAKQAAEYCKISKKYARYYVNIFNSKNEELKKAVENKEISVENAGKIAKLPKAYQDASIEEIKAGESAKKVIKSYEEKKKQEDKEAKKDNLNDSLVPTQEEIQEEVPEETLNEDPEVEAEEDEFGYNIDFFKELNSEIESSVDTTGEIGKLKKETSKGIGYYEEIPEVPEINDSKLQEIISWCDEVVGKDNLSDDEMCVIKKMKEVVDKFL